MTTIEFEKHYINNTDFFHYFENDTFTFIYKKKFLSVAKKGKQVFYGEFDTLRKAESFLKLWISSQK